MPGSELHGALAGHYKIKLRKQDYRLVYGVKDDVLIVMVITVDKREGRCTCRAPRFEVSRIP